jgi:hypothetical protein
MTMKSIFFAVAVAALVGAAIASCPNACSGHGSCGNHDRCTCYANFVGGDCSEKACPYGRSGQECSGRGICDRGAGSCECADGYSGASCQRTSCPNDCSGKGSCDTTTGMCSCAGGYSGNDCGTRLCPKGDDPLTHEVENSGDGTASQQSEVQTVTFNGGRGLGGTATLTYNDLYGQSWTTRPFNVGGDNVYRLEVSFANSASTACASTGHATDSTCDLTFTYNGNTATVAFHANGAYSSTTALSSGSLRASLLTLFGAYQTNAYVRKDRGNTIYVKRHTSTTSVKLGGAIAAGARITYDIVIPVDMSGHDDNGELESALTVAWKGAGPAVNTAALNLYQLGDRSAEIESALTSLPNQVIPSVTVSKVGVTDTGTNSDGANGNAYAQSYAITFNNDANSGDQNMLTCNAGPCDESGCINRGPGVSEVRYMHHDAENYGEGINFVNQGYFIMDVGTDAVNTGLGQGSIKIMWDTGTGIDSAIFAIVATAAEVQTALRTITGWEGVTVELWGSKEGSATLTTAAQVLVSHQFKVTFAAGYDDLGKSPTFYTMLNTDGAYATADPALARARLYDQRFSNSIWLGKVTGYVTCVQGGTTGCDLKSTDINGNAVAVDARASNGDVWVTSGVAFGHGGVASTPTAAPAGTGTEVTLQKDTDDAAGTQAMTTAIVSASMGTTAGTNFIYLKEGKISVQTSDYFAVGSTVEVLGTTWTQGTLGTDVATSTGSTSTGASNNAYRKFKITGHVTNEFNREFAKLDSFPADDGVTVATANTAKPDYNLKITSNNGTVHSYAAEISSKSVRINAEEIQVVILGTGQDDANTNQVWKLYYKGEESQNMDWESTAVQVAEEINGFSALSGPVTVTTEGVGTAPKTGRPRYVVKFAAQDGDVAEMTAVATTGAVTITTRAHGWSIESPIAFGLDTMQAGGIINVTASEVCTFAGTGIGTNLVGYWCYDGICGPAMVDAEAGGTPDGVLQSDIQNAIRAIKDDTGAAILSTATVDATITNSLIVTMPLAAGMSCDHLELRGNTNAAVIKSVDKNNNGKQFKITRSFIQKTAVAAHGDATTVTCGAGLCYNAQANVDSVVFGGASCDAKETTDTNYPIHRTISAQTSNSASNAVVGVTVAGLLAAPGNSGLDCESKYLARHVITLDSMPTESLTGVVKTLLYTSPVGSCSVAETTKGTYESFECSNRGACDGKSGLCTCYEGYSGQSCQTQTVLV